MSGVPYTDAAPRPYDVALFLCAGAIRMLAAFWTAQPQHARAVFHWYLSKIALLNVEDTSLATTRRAIQAWNERYREPTLEASLAPEREPGRPRLADEVDFGVALESVRVSANEEGEAQSFDGDAENTWGGLPERPRVAFDPEAATWIDESRDAARERAPLPFDAGFALIVEFLTLCRAISSHEALAVEASIAIIDYLEHQRVGTRSRSGGSLLGPGKLVVDTATLDHCFAMDEEAQNDSVMALGSATKSFHVIVSIAWACAGYAHQSALAVTVTSWVRCLTALLQIPIELSTLVTDCQRLTINERDVQRGGGGGPLGAAWREGAAINLTATYGVLRQVFEGHLEGRTAADGGSASVDDTSEDEDEEASTEREGASIRHFFSPARPAHLGDNYVAQLLAAQDSAGPSLIPRQDLYNRGTQPILQNITAGMLLYVQLCLSLRSLRIARQCSNMAVLVSHQLHSNAALALAHYSSCLVHMARGHPGEAADSIAIALQLCLSSASAAGGGSEDSVFEGSSGLSTTSLCFAGAAQLLLFYPSAVSTSLRAFLTTDATSAGAARYRLTLGIPAAAGGTAGAEEERANDPSPKTTIDSGALRHGTGGHAVVVQTVAQSVRNALWLSEATALRDQELTDGLPTPWSDVVGAMSRETLLTVGSLYGISGRPRALNEASLGVLLLSSRGLRDGDDESVAQREASMMNGPLVGASALAQPQTVLLTEAMRHTAHKMMAILTGGISVDSETVAALHQPTDEPAAALGVAADFLRGVGHNYGPGGLAACEQNVLLATTIQLCALSKLARDGFAAAAYDGLSGLVLRLFRHSGLSDKVHSSHGGGGGAAAADAAAVAECGLRNPFHTTDSARESAENEEDAILRYLRGGNAGGDLFWPPDHLLLLANVQRKRAEVALYLDLTTAMDRMQTVLHLISAQCKFAYGVLVSKYVDLLTLQAKAHYAAVVDGADELLRSLEGIGISSLVAHVQARKVSALSSAGRWREALRELDRMASTVPSALAPWFCLSRFTVGYECLLSLLHAPDYGGGDGAVCSALDRFVDEGLDEMTERGYLDADGTATCAVSLHEALSAQAAVARLFPSDTPSPFFGKVRQLAALLHRRQRVRHVFTCLFDHPLLRVCEELLAGELPAETGFE